MRLCCICVYEQSKLKYNPHRPTPYSVTAIDGVGEVCEMHCIKIMEERANA